MISPQFAQLVAARLGAPFERVYAYLSQWAPHEGVPDSINNPLATTLNRPGATNYNSSGVKVYPDVQSGAEATADTIVNYPGITTYLRTGQFNQQQVQRDFYVWVHGPNGDPTLGGPTYFVPPIEGVNAREVEGGNVAVSNQQFQVNGQWYEMHPDGSVWQWNGQDNANSNWRQLSPTEAPPIIAAGAAAGAQGPGAGPGTPAAQQGLPGGATVVTIAGEQYIYTPGLGSLPGTYQRIVQGNNNAQTATINGSIWERDPVSGQWHIAVNGGGQPVNTPTQIVNIGGRSVLVNTQTGETIRDLGPSGANQNSQTQVIDGTLYEKQPDGSWKPVVQGDPNTNRPPIQVGAGGGTVIGPDGKQTVINPVYDPHALDATNANNTAAADRQREDNIAAQQRAEFTATVSWYTSQAEIAARAGEADKARAFQQAADQLNRQFQAWDKSADRAQQNAQFAATFGLQKAQIIDQRAQIDLDRAKAFSESINDTDPLAYAAFLTAEGGGNIENAIARGGNALSDAAILPSAKILGSIRKGWEPLGDYAPPPIETNPFASQTVATPPATPFQMAPPPFATSGAGASVTQQGGGGAANQALGNRSIPITSAPPPPAAPLPYRYTVPAVSGGAGRVVMGAPAAVNPAYPYGGNGEFGSEDPNQQQVPSGWRGYGRAATGYDAGFQMASPTFTPGAGMGSPTRDGERYTQDPRITTMPVDYQQQGVSLANPNPAMMTNPGMFPQPLDPTRSDDAAMTAYRGPLGTAIHPLDKQPPVMAPPVTLLTGDANAKDPWAGGNDPELVQGNITRVFSGPETKAILKGQKPKRSMGPPNGRQHAGFPHAEMFRHIQNVKNPTAKAVLRAIFDRQISEMEKPMLNIGRAAGGYTYQDPLETFGVGAVTPEDRALIPQIRQFRQQVSYPGENPLSLDFYRSDPVYQDLILKGRQDKYGIPYAASRFQSDWYKPQGYAGAVSQGI